MGEGPGRRLENPSQLEAMSPDIASFFLFSHSDGAELAVQAKSKTVTELILNNVTKKFGSFTAVSDADLHFPDGKFVCFLGPSGCGKTTLLRIIAGLETPSSGSIQLDAQDVTNVPTHNREIGMVFQSLALFPHLTVAENIAYGMRMRGKSKAESHQRALELLETVRLPHIADRAITELSGGQRQRVAIARALALRPKLFLLDEPLSALDANMREEMQVELKQLQRKLGVTTIMVTHDQSEAMTAADLIVVMSAGRIEQIGEPLDVYLYPKNKFVAGFVGTNNLVDVKVKSDTEVEMLGSLIKVGAMPDELSSGVDATISIRPENVILHTDTSDKGDNRLTGKVTFVRDLGFEIEVFVEVGGQQITARWTPKDHPAFKEGDMIQLELPAADIRVYSE